MKKMSKAHWLAVAAACLMAVVPLLASVMDARLASLAPAVVAVLAVVKHALDSEDSAK